MRRLLTEFNLLNWNIAGGKFLEEEDSKRSKFKRELNRDLGDLLDLHKPDVVCLQELVQYRLPDSDRFEDIIEPIPDGYVPHFFKLIDTDSLSVRAKWNKIEKTGKWPKGTHFAQGNGFLFKDGLPHQPVWDLPKSGRNVPKRTMPNYVEKVGLESGLYFGDRDTEPRAALVAHFVFNPDDAKPLDIFVVNVHLTTLTREREGVPKIDREATRIRLSQLDVVFDGIVSRYNSWRRGGFLERNDHRPEEDWETFDRHEPVWILAGDFNSTPDSYEYKAIQGVNFMDVIKNKGAGTKAPGAGNPATLTLDYVFVGPAFVALDPLVLEADIGNNSVHDIRVSDHFPMTATIPIWGR
jgi:endonuclease/exonuclease/phosphatase family metal-dependent hydrolase